MLEFEPVEFSGSGDMLGHTVLGKEIAEDEWDYYSGGDVEGHLDGFDEDDIMDEDFPPTLSNQPSPLPSIPTVDNASSSDLDAFSSMVLDSDPIMPS